MDVLASLDSVFVKQKIDMLDVLTDFSQNRRYVVKNPAGNIDILYAGQRNNFLARNILPDYNMALMVLNSSKTELCHIARPKNNGFFSCPKMDVFLPPGTLVATLQVTSCHCIRSLNVFDAKNKLELTIKDPVPFGGIFDVANTSGVKIGKISKKFAGMQELFTNADNFLVEFKNLDLRTKWIMLGATFFMDAVFYEDQQFTCCSIQ